MCLFFPQESRFELPVTVKSASYEGRNIKRSATINLAEPKNFTYVETSAADCIKKVKSHSLEVYLFSQVITSECMVHIFIWCLICHWCESKVQRNCPHQNGRPTMRQTTVVWPATWQPRSHKPAAVSKRIITAWGACWRGRGGDLIDLQIGKSWYQTFLWKLIE